MPMKNQTKSTAVQWSLLLALWLAAGLTQATARTPPKEAAMSPYFRPEGSVVGDVIPFYWQGQYHLYYLQPDPEGMSWHGLVTPDFVTIEDWGEVLPHGTKDEQDVVAATGSVIEKDGLFYLFYDGANDGFEKEGRAPQVMMRATGRDLRHWEKDPAMRFPPAEQLGYERSAWRDPFVFWNEEAGEYWMLITARRGGNMPVKRRGCTAVAASADLEHWEMREPLYAPGLFDTQECHDLFKMGDWWYLVFSSYHGPWQTHYRMARSLKGPWLTPADDRFDAQAFYAAKTLGNDDGQRFVCGWLTGREGDKDDGKWLWGGNLLVHQLTQRADGTLDVRPVQAVLDQFTQSQPLVPTPRLGEWNVQEKEISTQSVGHFSALTLSETTPDPCLIEATVTFDEGTAHCSLFVRADSELGDCYAIQLNPGLQRVIYEAWPKPFNASLAMERPLTLQPGQPVHLKVIVEGTIIVIYVNDQVALSSRMYARNQGSLGLYVSEGQARFESLSVKTKQSQKSDGE